MDETNEPGEMGEEMGESQPGEPQVEICLCIYPDGKLALQVDDGEKVPVPRLDQALAGIKAFAEQELEGQNAQQGPAESDGEAQFAQGYSDTRGIGI